MSDRSKKANDRLTEGALSALTTPSKPPAPPKLVPLVEPKQADNGNEK